MNASLGAVLTVSVVVIAALAFTVWRFAVIFRGDSVTSEAEADLREQIAAHVEAIADNYPEDVFPRGGISRDAISGTAMRHAYRNAARSIREDFEPEGRSANG